MTKTEERYDWTNHPDFSKFYDTKSKITYWILGYFGGGSINIYDSFELAKKMSIECEVSLESIQIDEVLFSRSFKGYKVIFSNEITKNPKLECTFMDNVWSFLTQ